MSVPENNNARIAKNAIYLYARMLISMCVSLYTSRVILQSLGLIDYGIYNIVAGVITMLAFVNGALVSATQRYITVAIGGRDAYSVRNVFSTALQVHAAVAVSVCVLAQTIGLFFLYNKLDIPADRSTAALWVYQVAIVTCMVSIISVPYTALIIAHEKMSVFASVSLFEVFLKLVVTFLVVLFPYDKLIVYSILLLISQLIIRLIYSRYCHCHFPESYYRHRLDNRLLVEMATFSGWSLFGNFAAVLFTQGQNVLLNLFFGPVANAARGVAVQAQSAIYQFVINFQTALNPQITKSYAANDLQRMRILVFASARFSYCLLLLLALPVLIETEYVLMLWLGSVPPYSDTFLRLSLIIALLNAIANPLIISNQATGKIKLYQSVVGGLLLLIVPISYTALRAGAPAYSIFLVHIFVECVAQFARMFMLRRLINICLLDYFRCIYMPLIIFSVVSSIVPILVYQNLEYGFYRFLLVCLFSLMFVLISMYLVALTKYEKSFVNNKIYRFFKKNNNV